MWFCKKKEKSPDINEINRQNRVDNIKRLEEKLFGDLFGGLYK